MFVQACELQCSGPWLTYAAGLEPRQQDPSMRLAAYKTLSPALRLVRSMRLLAQRVVVLYCFCGELFAALLKC
jgi:hypothetical protein